MRSHVRASVVALVLSALIVFLAGVSSASAAEGGFEKFFAGNCLVATCGEHAVPPANKAQEEAEGFTQAGGFVPFGVTDFTLNKVESPGKPGQFIPVGFPAENLKNLRVDVPAGIVTNPQAVTRCTMRDFLNKEVEPVKHVFLAPKCPESSIIGTNTIETATEALTDVVLSGNVYNLEPSEGQGTTFGVALVVGAGVVVHTIIKGSVEYNSDYHDYFVINDIPPGLIESRLVFFGAENPTSKEKFGFVRNPTTCTTPGAETTTKVTGEFAKETATLPYETHIGSTGCEALKFEPKFSLLPETALSDMPDGITTELTDTHPENGSEPDSADVRTVTVKMPAGLTINPSAGAGLAGCTPNQAGVAPETKALEIQVLKPIGCPAGAKLGTVHLQLPTVPTGALQGPIYLAQEQNEKGEALPITKPPYAIYLDAESERYGIRVLLKGTVSPDPATGQLTATFNENPQAPFNDVILHLQGGAFSPLANPLVCGEGKTEASLTSFASNVGLPSESLFTTTGCASSPPAFAPTQETSVVPATGGSDTDLTFTLTRPEGQQYVEKVSTTLPAGVVGKIPSVPLCAEAQANATQASGQGCSAASQIGTVRVAAGSGEPYPFTGKVYLTGAYQGAPYGLSIKVPVVAGPFNLGEEVTRATISVDPHSARVTVASKLPTIKAGIPIRLRSLTVDVSRPNYILNPTSCDALKTESVLTSTLGTTASISSPFQAEGCSSLGFKPTFAASTSGKFSKNNGASLVTKITQPSSQANIKSVVVTLPKQLPSRLTTLQKSCPEATFAANPLSCNAESNVGAATVVTPVLPGKMTGPAYLVSHGGAAFPDLDLVLESNGIRVILVGSTDIKNGVTTSSFVTNPDVPVSSVEVNLPTGPHSALAAFGNLCTASLVMPTTITAQNGKQFKQNTKISPSGCGVQIVGHKVVGNTAYVTVKTFAAGRITGSGANLATVKRTLRAASKAATLKIPLSSRGKSKRRPLKVKVRVGFVPKKKGAHSSASVSLTFRH